jgi:hypothetical protein
MAVECSWLAREVRESLVTLRRLKRMGHLLDARGRATGEISSPL